MRIALSVCLVALAASSCQAKRPEPALVQESSLARSTAEPAGKSSEPAPGSARLGSPAPDFELRDLDGKAIRLSSYRGSPVVLEWFNPECPFVKLSHSKGSLVNTAARHAQHGVVWLAINSAAAGKQGHASELNRAAKERYAMGHPLLMDADGVVGRAYAAERTPHLYVIDKEGVLRYRGAIDNSPDGEGQSAPAGKLVNYVDAAIADLGAGRGVATAETEAYGCSVKYTD